jgi:light-regulated signal transduction histidine kinase (bacteriophytochrome)
MLLNARQIQQASGKERIILLAIEDITERKEIEAGLEKTRRELEVANKELEAFSYSVSHDLRAPLRHISGYVELLVKHFQSELSEKGVHYLDSIADSAHQMGKLIDTLLQFSRIGRAEMHRSQLEMNKIVQEVVESVSKDNPDRTIEWVVRKLPSVSGDDATLRLVWVNLLSNAAKFTRTRKYASIEIGAKDETKEVIFFVKDNGVGFDMKYAQKLFGVFQRLHPTEEFEGTGIGLANVNRIVMRHGGRAWAEAEVNKGATFYFSLPK